jgi:hypothetical protein
MTRFIKVVNISAIFENGEFLHSLGHKATFPVIFERSQMQQKVAFLRAILACTRCIECTL